MERELTTIDLFAGAGGMSEGFRQAGFRVLAANDFDDVAGETFKLNFPEAAFVGGKIESITSEALLSAACMRREELTVLAGGPPCQAFSVYNHQRGMHDARSGLFRQYLRVVKGLMPRFVVLENVTGITSVGDGRAMDEIHRSLASLGYHVEHRILRAEQYGIPQERRRIFFIGSRDSSAISWPQPTHCAAGSIELFTLPHLEEWAGASLKTFVTVDDAIGDLPALAICEGEDESPYGQPPRSQYQKEMRRGSRSLYNHVAPFLADINLKRLRHIPQGGSWRDIPHAMLPAGMKLAKRSDHTKRYGRLHPEGLCCTILTKCDLHWGSFIHPTQERTLTVREAARFQSFPDRIRFLGSRVDQFRQAGNAVPPLLGRAVAMEIRKMLGASVEDRAAVHAG